MSDIKIYGIKNCDTMKKTFKWLEQEDVSYEFHDYKKSGVPVDVIQSAIEKHGWEVVINKRGTTWRKLDDSAKADMTDEKALDICAENPSIIKRPLFLANNSCFIGFGEENREKILI